MNNIEGFDNFANLKIFLNLSSLSLLFVFLFNFNSYEILQFYLKEGNSLFKAFTEKFN